MAKTDVHYPTDVSLLWDAVRCLLLNLGSMSPRSVCERLLEIRRSVTGP